MKQTKLPSEYISDFINFISKTRALYNLYSQELKTKEQITQDYIVCWNISIPYDLA